MAGVPYSNFPQKDPVRQRFTTMPAEVSRLSARLNKTIKETARKVGEPSYKTTVPVWARPVMGLLIDEYESNYGETPEIAWTGRAMKPRKETYIHRRLPSIQHIISTEHGGSNKLGNTTILRQADNSRLAAGQSVQDFYNRDLTDPDVAQGKAQAVYPWLVKEGQVRIKYKIGAGQKAQTIIEFADDNFTDVGAKKMFVANATEYTRLLESLGEDARLNQEDLNALKERTILDLDKVSKQPSTGISIRGVLGSLLDALPDESRFFRGSEFTEPTRAWRTLLGDAPSAEARKYGGGRFGGNAMPPGRR